MEASVRKGLFSVIRSGHEQRQLVEKANPQFSTLCLRSSTKSKAHVELKLQVGMPNANKPYSRPVSPSALYRPLYPILCHNHRSFAILFAYCEHTIPGL